MIQAMMWDDSKQWLIDTLNGMEKLFNKEEMTEDELQAVKDFLTGPSTLSDMDDSTKQTIRDATHENIYDTVKQASISTVERSFRYRYGITLN